MNGIKARQEEQQHKDPRAAAQELVALIGRLVACRDTIFAAVHDTYGPPSALTRYWIPAVVVYVSANAAARVVFERQEAIRAWFRELGETARDFAVHWIWEPMLKVWETIRLRDQRLSVLSKEGLRSDLDVCTDSAAGGGKREREKIDLRKSSLWNAWWFSLRVITMVMAWTWTSCCKKFGRAICRLCCERMKTKSR